MTTRVALYVRVSTANQTQAQTIDQQVDRLRAYVTEQQWRLEDRHIYRDDGRSGADLNRPGLDHLRDAVHNGDVDHVLLTAPDRLARNYVQQMIVLDELERFGAQVEFLDRPMSNDPHDRLLLQIRGAVAEYERTLIADRMRRGRQRRYQAGTLLPWSCPPYGYRLNPDRPRDPTGLTTDAAEAALVGEIFAWYTDADMPLCSIAKRLTALGVSAPKGGHLWSVSTLSAILRQPAYTGHIYAGRFHTRAPKTRRSATHPLGKPHDSLVAQPPETWIEVATIPALIPQEQFDRAQEKLQLQHGICAPQQFGPRLLAAGTRQLWAMPIVLHRAPPPDWSYLLCMCCEGSCHSLAQRGKMFGPL